MQSRAYRKQPRFQGSVIFTVDQNREIKTAVKTPTQNINKDKTLSP